MEEEEGCNAVLSVGAEVRLAKCTTRDARGQREREEEEEESRENAKTTCQTGFV